MITLNQMNARFPFRKTILYHLQVIGETPDNFEEPSKYPC